LTKNEKIEIVNSITKEFKSSEAIVICDYRGLDVKAIEVLRDNAKKLDVNVRVIKNKLASIAMKNADITGIELKDTNIFVWGSDQLDVTKVVSKFAEISKIFTIKTAFIEGEVASADKVEALSKMPTRDELLSMLLRVWNAPITNFTVGLDALRATKEEESA
jgi:large subunit ribosomal protein L10